MDQPFPNHNGGQVLFGPDGYLYVMLGDGGSADDPGGRGQSLDDLLGSILRIESGVDAGGYTVPADNPFVGTTGGARPEIWSYGLRNPWRVAFDAGDRRSLHRRRGPAAVGGGRASPPPPDGAGRGVNFGWNIMEGPECFRESDPATRIALELPVVSYDHGDGCSITGGFVYRGAAIPALHGHYFYSDYLRRVRAQLSLRERGRAWTSSSGPRWRRAPTCRASASMRRASCTS